jgi:hypothetical protein
VPDRTAPCQNLHRLLKWYLTQPECVAEAATVLPPEMPPGEAAGTEAPQ